MIDAFEVRPDGSIEYLPQEETPPNAPYKPGEKVYIKSIDYGIGPMMPVRLINKQFTIDWCLPVECSDGEIWDIGLVEEVEAILTQENICREKPY